MTIEVVCAGCIGDQDLRQWIMGINGPRGCDACRRRDAPTCQLSALCHHMSRRLSRYWAMAADYVGYCTADGGYIGAPVWDTYDLLRDEVCLDLPRDSSSALFLEIVDRLPDHVWCQVDPYNVGPDVALSMSWQRFCQVIKFERRFFFHDSERDTHDSYSPVSLLAAVARFSQHAGLISTIGAGTRLWRVGHSRMGRQSTAADYGPPPAQIAMQSNRMNPAGIPMMYLASTSSTALKEAKLLQARVGRWQVARPLRLLDLRRLPPIPGIFSDAGRSYRLTLTFLHEFCDTIMQPIDRTERVNIDYLPSQVATEFFRDFPFEDGPIDGIAYGSTVSSGWNVVLFASRQDVGIQAAPDQPLPQRQWLTFVGARLFHLPPP